METLSAFYEFEKKRNNCKELLSELANCAFKEINFLLAGGKVLLK